MHYPSLQTIAASREAISVFRGLNQQGDIGSGEFAAMENMTSDYYPQAATCCPPSFFNPEIRPQALLSKEVLCYVQGKSLFMDEEEFDLGLTPGEKELISMGAYILIMPDKKYFNTADYEDFGPIDRMVEAAQWQIDPCDSQGNVVVYDAVSAAAPASPQDGAIWYDTGGAQHTLKQYDGALDTWTPIQGYVRLKMKNAGSDGNDFTSRFSSGDRVPLQIFGDTLIDDGGNPLKEKYPEGWLEQAIWNLAGEVKLQVLDGTSALLPGLVPASVCLGNTLRLGDAMPDMDFLFECGNRLWGCRCGKQNGKFVNEIYASALGDFRRWSSFQGVSTDAYTASVGTDGPFTGAMNYLGYPLFFKEHYIHRVYGSYPAEYRIQTTPCMGIAPGSGRSLCLLGDTALYFGRTGIYAYDGALPSLISQNLKPTAGPGVAGVLGEKYYLSLPGGLYVYNSRRRLWHRRSAINAAQMCNWYGRLLYFDRTRQGIKELDGGDSGVTFSLETGILASTEQRSIRSICLRYSLKGWGRVMVEYDSSGVWLAAGTLPETGLGWIHLPLRPCRCDHFRLKLCGEGSLRLYSIIKTLEKGSDLP